MRGGACLCGNQIRQNAPELLAQFKSVSATGTINAPLLDIGHFIMPVVRRQEKIVLYGVGIIGKNRR